MTAILSLDAALQGFQPVSLAELDRLNFTDRLDSKSLFAERLLPEFLEQLIPHYNILEQQGKRIFQYESLYFDTPKLKLFSDHHRGIGHRHKIRYRTYLDTNATFFEIKTKNNKGRNHKLRVPVTQMLVPLPHNLKTIIREQTQLDPDTLLPTLSVTLNRITLIHRDGSEKITFDSDIHFNFSGNSKNLEGIAITEVKQKKFNPESPFFQIQHSLGIRPASVSKYCLGISLLDKERKANRFKAGLLRLEKMMA